MEQIKGMLRDTWWLWLLFITFNTLMVIFFSKLFLFIYPALVVVCVYFAYGRYDEEGRERNDF